MKVTALKRIKIVTFIYAALTLLTHLTALFLAIYRLMSKNVNQTLLSRADELLSYGFVYLCFGFMIIAAILLIANRICAADYLRLHEIFWLTLKCIWNPLLPNIPYCHTNIMFWNISIQDKIRSDLECKGNKNLL